MGGCHSTTLMWSHWQLLAQTVNGRNDVACRVQATTEVEGLMQKAQIIKDMEEMYPDGARRFPERSGYNVIPSRDSGMMCILVVATPCTHTFCGDSVSVDAPYLVGCYGFKQWYPLYLHVAELADGGAKETRAPVLSILLDTRRKISHTAPLPQLQIKCCHAQCITDAAAYFGPKYQFR